MLLEWFILIIEYMNLFEPLPEGFEGVLGVL